MAWISHHNSFEAFRRALRRPNDLFLEGYLRGQYTVLTATTILEEREHIIVEGVGGWRAEVFVAGREARTAQLRSFFRVR